jgi:hypothetical protein
MEKFGFLANGMAHSRSVRGARPVYPTRV